MSLLTKFIYSELIEEAWDNFEVVEPSKEQLLRMKQLVEHRLDVLSFPHMYNDNEERK